MGASPSPREDALLRQQDVLARFGELAVRSDDLDEILHEACRLVGEALGTDLAKVMELQEGGDTLLVRAGVGWQPGIVGHARIAVTPDGCEGYALLHRQAVISNDVEAERRFSCPPFVRDAGVRTLVMVLIVGHDDDAPYGLLQVDSRGLRRFTQHDVQFLRGYANLIAAAVHRLRTAGELRSHAARLGEVMARQEAAMETGLIGFFVWHVRAGIITADRRFADFFRLDPAQAEAGATIEEVCRHLHPDDLPALQAAVRATAGAHAKYTAEIRLQQEDGTIRWLLLRSRHDPHGAGRPLRYTGTAVDITASKSVEAALRESEERFRQFAAASSDALWIRDARTQRFEYVSPAFATLYGTPAEAVAGEDDLRRWAALILPEDREPALRAVERARQGENVTHEFRIERVSDGEVRWLRDTVFPLLDRAGRLQRIGGIAHDVTEEHASAGRMQVMVAELQHRTRNLIAVIHALASKTLARSGSLAEFGERFGARLQALARANGLLSRLEEGERITFDALIQAELSALGVYDPERQGVQVVLDGPAGIRLRSGTVQIFALALHELATNALKYGALSAPEGRLVVRWRSERGEAGQLRLRVDWEESGVRMPPDLATTGRRGHGRELIERALPFQLKARTRYTVGADGIRCTIDLPVSSDQGGPRESRHADARPAASSSPAGGGG